MSKRLDEIIKSVNEDCTDVVVDINNGGSARCSGIDSSDHTIEVETEPPMHGYTIQDMYSPVCKYVTVTIKFRCKHVGVYEEEDNGHTH